MTVETRSRRFSAAVLELVATRLMKASSLCALATVSPGGRAHINHMYFASMGAYRVVWFSDRDSVHSRNLARRGTAAITIYDSQQVIGHPDRGIQLFGAARAAADKAADDASRVYERRFGVDPSGYQAYVFRPRTVKLFDERSLSPGMLVTARVTRGGLDWAKTEAGSSNPG